MPQYIATTTKTSTCSFYNNSAVLFDPTTVQVTVTTPSGTSTTYTTANTYPTVGVTNPSTGVYVLKIELSEAGTYTITWYGYTAGSSGGKITVLGTLSIL